MSARPGRWELVGYDSDPLPHSSTEVSAEAKHYSTIASTIQSQIEWLRRLEDPDARLEGQFVEPLSDDCDDLADNLGKIHNRYETVGEQLDKLEGALLTARLDTISAVRSAESAWDSLPEDERAGQLNRLTGPTDPGLRSAWNRAHGAVGAYHDVAEGVAKKIKDASDDDMKDSRWDRFKDWVSGFADVLDFLCDLAGILCAIIMVVCIFIPGPGWLIAAAMGLALFALAGHTLLAATGNGSWLDVAFDVVAILTMGVGGRLLKLATSARGTVLTTQATRAGTQASSAVINRGLFNGGRGIIGNLHRFYRVSLSGTWQTRAASAYDDAFRQWSLRGMPQTTITSRLSALGDNVLASHLQEVRLLTQELGGEAITQYSRLVQGAHNFNIASAVTEFSETLMNPKLGPNLEAWDFAPHEWASDGLTFSLPLDGGS